MVFSEYKKFYKKIGSVECHYFGDEAVVFNRKGFNHLLRKGKHTRSPIDQNKRLALLIHCENILKNRHSCVEHKIIKETQGLVQFWRFATVIDRLEIRLVVRQVGTGVKHFFSIFPVER